MATENNNQAIIDTMKSLLVEEEHTIDVDPRGDPGVAGVPFIVVPAGRNVVSLAKIMDEFRTKPVRRTGTARIMTEQSFVDQVSRFKAPNTVIFANVVAEGANDATGGLECVDNQLIAVFDYHPAGPENKDAAYGSHRAIFPFPMSEEWQAWMEQDGKAMTQAEFAAFIESRILDIVSVDLDDPTSAKIKHIVDAARGTLGSPSSLMDVSRSLEVRVSANIVSNVTLATGEMKFGYQEEHTVGEIKVPNLFAIGIPVLYDGMAYRLVCRLRYRLVAQKPQFWYEIIKPDLCLDDAIKEVVQRVNAATGVPVIYGTPEA